MKKNLRHLVILLIANLVFAASYSQKVDSVLFFTADQAAEMTLTTDIKTLQAQKKDEVFQDGSVELKLSTNVSLFSAVGVAARGKFRRENCRIPPMMLDFRKDSTGQFTNLGKLKLVIACGANADDEQLLLKEYLIYKIYNLLEEKSFRVRLVHTTFNDTRNRVKRFTQYSFLIEDDADMARRNGCKKKDHAPYSSESTNRALMTKVAIFEYLIGNADWSVPNLHNIKLIFDRKNDMALPFAVPYDFDYCGLVDAAYAVPSEVIGTEKITERVYRGFPRTMEELQLSFDIFREKKEAIYSLINNFSLLTARNKKTMTDYIDEFYEVINDKKQVQTIFIDNARTR
ncbi:MAG: hypothetical protein JNM88_02515 [Chitinophagaceae bacterium]|nr:hypothetical protein [Chitinophagaceae bacterium]